MMNNHTYFTALVSCLFFCATAFASEECSRVTIVYNRNAVLKSLESWPKVDQSSLEDNFKTFYEHLRHKIDNESFGIDADWQGIRSTLRQVIERLNKKSVLQPKDYLIYQMFASSLHLTTELLSLSPTEALISNSEMQKFKTEVKNTLCILGKLVDTDGTLKATNPVSALNRLQTSINYTKLYVQKYWPLHNQLKYIDCYLLEEFRLYSNIAVQLPVMKYTEEFSNCSDRHEMPSVAEPWSMKFEHLIYLGGLYLLIRIALDITSAIMKAYQASALEKLTNEVAVMKEQLAEIKTTIMLDRQARDANLRLN